MAHMGAGWAEFFDPKTKSKWERKVKAQLDKAFQPALSSVSVQWQQFDDNAPAPIQVCMHALSASNLNFWSKHVRFVCVCMIEI